MADARKLVLITRDLVLIRDIEQSIGSRSLADVIGVDFSDLLVDLPARDDNVMAGPGRDPRMSRHPPYMRRRQ